jgi:hypothetical protein
LTDEPHFNARHLLGEREVADGHLTGPPASLDGLVREGEGIFEGWLAACVGGRRVHGVRFGCFEWRILRAELLLVHSGVVIAALVCSYEFLCTTK